MHASPGERTMRRLITAGLTCTAVLLTLSGSADRLAAADRRSGTVSRTSAERSAAQTAWDQHVFMVHATKCPSSPATRRLSGFRVRASGSTPTGIVTALHGVAGCRSITAWNPRRWVIENLRVKNVSIPGDLALLSTDSLDRVSTHGFAVGSASGTSLAAMTQPRVAGHAYGALGADSREVQITQPPTERISNIAINNMITMLTARNSPDPSRYAVALVGPIAPGHSGAPLYTGLTAVAVVSGGQLNMTNGKSWAIPLQSVQWASGTTPLPAAVLGTPPKDALYFIESADGELVIPPLPPPDTGLIQPLLPVETEREDAVDRADQFIRTVVTLTPDGEVWAQVRVRNENPWFGFCATSAIAVFDAADNLLGTVEAGSQWCVDGKRLAPVTSPSLRNETYRGQIDPAVVPRVDSIAIIHQKGSKDVVGNWLRERIRNRASRTQQ
jgi:hypothetical protein